MVALGKSPFDDASGQDFLSWFATKGGLPNFVYDNVTPAGTVLADAEPISLGNSIVRSTAAGAGLRLPDVAAGAVLSVTNADASHTFKLWPGDTATKIFGSSSGASVTIPVSTTVSFQKISETEWIKLNSQAL